MVGSGPGSDAAFLAGLGWTVTGFDVAPSAVAAAAAPVSRCGTIDFQVADVLQPPADWTAAYDLVLESYTVQALPVALRPAVIARSAALVAPRRNALVLAAAEDQHIVTGPPWPLTRADVESFARPGLETVRIEDLRPRTGTPLASAVPPVWLGVGVVPANVLPGVLGLTDRLLDLALGLLADALRPRGSGRRSRRRHLP